MGSELVRELGNGVRVGQRSGEMTPWAHLGPYRMDSRLDSEAPRLHGHGGPMLRAKPLGALYVIKSPKGPWSTGPTGPKRAP